VLLAQLLSYSGKSGPKVQVALSSSHTASIIYCSFPCSWCSGGDWRFKMVIFQCLLISRYANLSRCFWKKYRNCKFRNPISCLSGWHNFLVTAGRKCKCFEKILLSRWNVTSSEVWTIVSWNARHQLVRSCDQPVRWRHQQVLRTG